MSRELEALKQLTDDAARFYADACINRDKPAKKKWRNNLKYCDCRLAIWGGES